MSSAGAPKFENITVRSMLESPRQDDGYFGPQSVTWKVVAHPAALNVGGSLAVLLQILDPGEMRHLSQTTVAMEGGEASEARFRRTGAYLITVNFGDTAHADAAAAHVDRLHERSVFVDPLTGLESRAKKKEWLQWTHNTFVWGTLVAALEYGLKLTPEEQDQYIVEQHKAAALLHVPTPLPSTRAELDAVIESWGERAGLILPAAEIARKMRNPGATKNPVQNWVAKNTQNGLLALLPEWAVRLYGLDGLNARSIRAGKRWMGLFMKIAEKNRTMEQMIQDSLESATVHPYQKVRKPRVRQ